MLNASLKVSQFSKSSINAFRDPFVYGYIDNFLSDELYALLSENFIDPSSTQDLEVFTSGKRRALFKTPPLPSFVGNEIWLDFLAEISSQEYLDDCFNWVAGNQIADKEKLYQPLLQERLRIDKRNLGLQCEFSSLNSGTLLKPHTDSTDKFLSCVLYFSPPNWDSRWGGGTDVYKPKSEKFNFNWGNKILSLDQMDKVFTCAYKPNRLFFFIKSYNSWHGISEVRQPPGFERRSFNFALRSTLEKVSDLQTQFLVNINTVEQTIFD